jgi:hypothetical protein
VAEAGQSRRRSRFAPLTSSWSHTPPVLSTAGGTPGVTGPGSKNPSASRGRSGPSPEGLS